MLDADLLARLHRNLMEVSALNGELPGGRVERGDGTKSSFTATARLDTPVEINYYRNGGILTTVLRKMLKG